MDMKGREGGVKLGEEGNCIHLQGFNNIKDISVQRSCHTSYQPYFTVELHMFRKDGKPLTDLIIEAKFQLFQWKKRRGCFVDFLFGFTDHQTLSQKCFTNILLEG